MKTKKQNMLRSFLIPILDNWSIDEIQKTINEINNDNKITKSEKPKSTYKKPNYTETVNKLYPSSENKELLLDIANRFENKSFLPSISDIRNFLEMRGHSSSNIKQRTESFKVVIKVIAELPDENISRIIKNNAYSGPSELGPLSDAIKQASNSIRGSEKPSEKPDSSKIETDEESNKSSFNDKDDQKS